MKKNLLTLYQRHVEAFNRAVQKGENFDASGEDGLSVVQVTSAIIEAASPVRSVKIAPVHV